MIRIGISGWTYPKWRKTFYPPELPRKSELAYASRRFPTIEINGSFYSLQTPRAYRSWVRLTPPNFVFSVKGGRFITHMKRLKDVDRAVANFFASGVLLLGSDSTATGSRNSSLFFRGRSPRPRTLRESTTRR